LKWRWSRVATSLMLRRSAMATTEASTMAKGKISVDRHEFRRACVVNPIEDLDP